MLVLHLDIDQNRMHQFTTLFSRGNRGTLIEYRVVNGFRQEVVLLGSIKDWQTFIEQLNKEIEEN